MSRHLFRVVMALTVTLSFAASDGESPGLTIAQRVQAEEAIRRLQHTHQVDATKPFSEAVSREALETRVRRYLRKSVALETYWGKPVTGTMLDRELRRIARETRFPERLERIFDALGNDPLLIHECFARPSLVERLTHQWYERQPLDVDQDWSAWWAAVQGTLNEHSVRVPADLPPVLPPIGLRTQRDDADCDSWDQGVLGEALQNGMAHTAVWTGNEMLVYGGSLSYAGWRYDPLIDDWTPMARPQLELLTLQASFSTASGAPHTAVWTGDEMIVWGNALEPIGARYDPLTDSWSVTSTLDAPEPRTGHTAVWTGEKMILWGGRHATNYPQAVQGASYDVATDTWLPVSPNPSATQVEDAVAVWTGTHMIVWDGPSDRHSGRYLAEWDTWLGMSMTNAPPAWSEMSVVWTGTEMIVWGGLIDNYPLEITNLGARYDPSLDVWTPMSTLGAPEARRSHTAIWTGTEMIVWGGRNAAGANGVTLNSGASYDPVTDSWSPISDVGAALDRTKHSAIWTGTEMIVWGGVGGYPQTIAWNSGGRYDPAADTWLSTSTGPAAPGARERHDALWTGTEMIVWGGNGGSYPSGGHTGPGGRYDPLVDAWLPISSKGAPPEFTSGGHAVWTGEEMIVLRTHVDYTDYRYDPLWDHWRPMAPRQAQSGESAVWTGEKLIVWGGEYSCGALDTGQTYDPDLDEWSPISSSGAPHRRGSHYAFWTGDEMIVWGGRYWYVAEMTFCASWRLHDGGKYTPSTGQWSPVTADGAPQYIYGQSAVWTGSEMIVWGGCSREFCYNQSGPASAEGGRYDPETDTWSHTSTAGAPPGRAYHDAVWTGERMIVWGGLTPVLSKEGGVYDPATDSWAELPTPDHVDPRLNHRAVWTGAEMIVWGGTLDPSITEGYADSTARSNGGIYDPSGPNPGPVTELAVGRPAPDVAQLSWMDVDRADSYAVIRGTLDALAAGSYGACLIGGLTEPEYVDLDPVPAGESFTYLVRGENACGIGGLGTDSSGVPRDSDSEPCP